MKDLLLKALASVLSLVAGIFALGVASGAKGRAVAGDAIAQVAPTAAKPAGHSGHDVRSERSDVPKEATEVPMLVASPSPEDEDPTFEGLIFDLDQGRRRLDELDRQIADQAIARVWSMLLSTWNELALTKAELAATRQELV